MPILVSCPMCAGQLRIPDELIGRKARCPACQTVFEATAVAEAPPPPVARLVPPQDGPVETVRIEPWRQLDLELANQSAAPTATAAPAPVPAPASEPPPPPPGLVGAVEVDAGPDPSRPPAQPVQRPPRRDEPDDLRRCPDCGKMIHRDSRRCYACGAASDDEPAQRNGPSRPGPARRDERFLPTMGRRDCDPHRGSTVLVLGVLSLTALLVFWVPIVSLATSLVGAVLGVVAWWLGHVDLRRMRQDTMDSAGRGSTQAGYICGIIGAILNVLWMLTCAGCLAFTAYQDMQNSQNLNPPTFQPPPKAQPKNKMLRGKDRF